MTIKDILEKVDLFNITVESGGDSPKDEKVIVGKPPGTRVKVRCMFKVTWGHSNLKPL